MKVRVHRREDKDKFALKMKRGEMSSDGDSLREVAFSPRTSDEHSNDNGTDNSNRDGCSHCNDDSGLAWTLGVPLWRMVKLVVG